MIDHAALSDLIAYWRDRQGGAERANYQLFIGQLTAALGVPPPQAGEGGTLGDYQFEAPVPGGARGGGTGFIDLYRRGCFILEAKQSRMPAAGRDQAGLFDPDAAAPAAPSGAKYDALMRDARRQAEHYAHSLPGSHNPVPFVIVCDVGRAFELYFDYAGNGRGYGFFPDKRSYRIALSDLAGETAMPGTGLTPAQTLRAIWDEPATIDPRTRSADVTRDVARKLAQVSRHLEQEGRDELRRRGAGAHGEAELVEGTALFLMRILFCMFAEDVGLLPENRFTEFLRGCKRPYNPDRPGDVVDEQTLQNGLVQLWDRMGSPDPDNRFAFALREPVRYFNGGLFETRAYFRLGINDLDSLIDAAEHRWNDVEPAIFGTLLEQALSSADRAKLGAHYTPRPYVERLVQATIGDVLGTEWAEAEAAIEAAKTAGDDAGALARAETFLAYLQAQRVLDPACGTGNFLYVAMETLLRLESRVIETIAELGGAASPAIGPANFLGLELNPRAAVIAELVLWIGWLRWRTANDPAAVPDPVLRRTATINFGRTRGYDAVLARDAADELEHPPRPADWPEAEFIVGNPPFIGKGAAMRRELTDEYVQALWKAAPAMPGSADFVMFWWDRAADLLTADGTSLRRFGFVTTNSITGSFNRRVVARHLAKGSSSLVFALPDHPWHKGAKDAAAVRIAMTVCQAGEHEGRLVRIVGEHGLDTNDPLLTTEVMHGLINADLSIGTDVAAATALGANAGIAHDGVKLHGKGFTVSRDLAMQLGLGSRLTLEKHIRPYRNGKDLSQRNPAVVRDKMIIDFFGLAEKAVRMSYPEAYQHVLQTVKPERDVNRRATYRDNWWVFGEPRRDMRPALVGLSRYIATVDTAKHRVFQFVEAEVLCDDKLVVIASDDPYHLAVLSAQPHTVWALRVGGWLGVGNDSVYVKSRTFDPFPFPDPTPEQRSAIGELGEELDRTRKDALAEHPRLTMTGLYNLVAALRAGAVPTAAQEVDVRDARARIVLRLHDQLDRAVAQAYGWTDAEPPGPATIVARLVALNAERASEEAAGHIRWLRPDYQRARFGRSF